MGFESFVENDAKFAAKIRKIDSWAELAPGSVDPQDCALSDG
jgi:hypothetical protein